MCLHLQIQRNLLVGKKGSRFQYTVTFEMKKKMLQPQRFRKINIRCHIVNTHTHVYTHQHTQTNIWGNVIICLLQMCRDFPHGVVNVNRISRDIITLLKRRRRSKRRWRHIDIFCSHDLSHWGDAKMVKPNSNKRTAGGWWRNRQHLKPMLWETEATRSHWKSHMFS